MHDLSNTKGLAADLPQGEPANDVLSNYIRGYFAGTTIASFAEDNNGNFYLNPINEDVIYIPKSNRSLV